jgi:hypothetical protein
MDKARGTTEDSSTPEKQTTPKVARKQTSSSRPTTPKNGRGPASGEFKSDPTRAAITTDASARKVNVMPPTQILEKDKAFWARAKTATNSPAGSPRGSIQISRSFSNDTDSMPARPFTAKSTLGSMFNGNLDILRNNDNSGIEEAFFPYLSNRPQTSFSSHTEDSELDHNVDTGMMDLVNIDDSGSDMGDQPTSFGPPMNEDLFDHFTQNRGVIGSFRQNQQYARHISSQASHPAQRASTHEFNALQKGRRGAANTPITPARKKRASQDITLSRGGVRKSPLTTRRPHSRGNSMGAGLAATFNKALF